MAPISIGDLVDKITILQVKLEKITDPQKRMHISNELEKLIATLTLIPQATELEPLMQQLKAINSTLWDIENAIRAKEAHQEFDTEFIEIARGVYLNNGKRHDLKRTINLLTNSEIIEEKQYTKYQ
jgi:hypothetical protein